MGTRTFLSAENGTNGTALSAANVPLTQSPTNGTGSTSTFSSTQKAHGSLAYRFQAATTTQATGRVAVTSSKTQSFRFAFYVASLPPSATQVRQFFAPRQSGGNIMRFRVGNTGALSWVDAAGANTVTTTETVTASTWYELSVQFVVGVGTTDGTYTVNLYALNGTTPINATPYTSSTYNLGSVACAFADLGVNDTSAGAIDLYLDSFRAEDGVTSDLGPLVVSVNAALSGSGTLTAAVAEVELATAAFTGSGTLTASAIQGAARTADFSGSGALAAAVIQVEVAAAPFVGSGALSATVVEVQARTASFTGSGALAAAAVASLAVTAALTGSGTLTALSGAAQTVTFSGSGSLSAAAVPRVAVTAAFTGSGALSALVGQSGSATALFTGSGTLSAVVSIAVSAALSGSGALTGAVARNAAAQFSGSGQLNAAVQVVAVVGAPFSGAGSLAADVLVVVAVAADMSGAGLLSAQVALRYALLAAFTGSGDLAATAQGFGPPRDITIAGVLGNRRVSASMSSRHVTGDLATRRWSGSIT